MIYLQYQVARVKFCCHKVIILILFLIYTLKVAEKLDSLYEICEIYQ